MTVVPPERIVAGDVVLRRVRESDAALIADTVAANLTWLAPWMTWAVPIAGTVEEQRRRTPVAVARWDQGVSFQYLAFHSRTGAHLGNFGLERRIGPRALEIGYWLAEAATGQGYATTAVRALTATALDLADVDRVEIHHHHANRRSSLVPQRLGYQLDRIESDGVDGRSLVWTYQDPQPGPDR